MPIGSVPHWNSFATNGLTSEELERPRQLSPGQLDIFPVQSVPIGDSPGRNVWLAMPSRPPRLPLRLRFLGYRTPLPKRLVCRRSDDTTPEHPSWLVPSSVRPSFPSRSSCLLFLSNLLFPHHLLVIPLLFPILPHFLVELAAWFRTDQRQCLFTLPHQAVSSALLISLRTSWE